MPDNADSADAFYKITPAAFYERFALLESMAPDSSPLVRQVMETKERVRALDLKFYAVLGAIVTGLTGYGVIVLAGSGNGG